MADLRIERLRDAAPDERERLIADLIVSVARPLAANVLRGYAGSLSPQDAEDLLASVCLRLLVKLRGAAAADGIAQFDQYAAMVTYNAVSDHLRRTYPRRTRLKNRLRYALSSDPQLAVWTSNDRLVGGLVTWRGRTPATEAPSIPPRFAADYDHPAEALLALFAHVRSPLSVDALVDLFADLWNIVDAPPEPMRETIDPRAQVHEPVESQETLAALWREIALLRPMQRAALLLNLRDPDTANVLQLFVASSVATMEDIAKAVRMTPTELAAIWPRLPLDDLTIASMLELTRQQVITLRRSARERLTRRMGRGKGTP